MDIEIKGHNVDITDRFREYATEKAQKIAKLAPKALVLEIRVNRHNPKPLGSQGSAGNDRVELTVVGPGPIIRGESEGQDKYSAFDLAFGRILERVRRARDKQKVHRGLHRSPSTREEATTMFRDLDIEPADAELIDAVEAGEVREDAGPIVIRKKQFPGQYLTADDAVGRMELLGHDFFLFIDVESKQPSVVYRRKGWSYGVIGLDQKEPATV